MVEIHWTHHVLGWEMAQILWVGRDHSLSILKLEFWTNSETFESVLATDAIIYLFFSNVQVHGRHPKRRYWKKEYH